MLAWVFRALVSDAARHRVSLTATLPLLISNSPFSFASGSDSLNAVTPCFRCVCISMLHNATLCVRVKGKWKTIFLRAHEGFCKCKQLILSLPPGFSARLSVNRREIMFICATPPPATYFCSSTPLVLPLSPLLALNLPYHQRQTALCRTTRLTSRRSYLTDLCSNGRGPYTQEKPSFQLNCKRSRMRWRIM